MTRVNEFSLIKYEIYFESFIIFLIISLWTLNLIYFKHKFNYVYLGNKSFITYNKTPFENKQNYKSKLDDLTYLKFSYL